jgi:hypothetical protein
VSGTSTAHFDQLSLHWYIVSPDNTFGQGFDWATAPWFDANGLNDVAKISSKTVVEKLQAEESARKLIS